jgi:glycerophosphoryl diester phosphodiesterase
MRPDLRPSSTNPAMHPLVIAHRGASGERPEHTLAAYSLAIEQGADYVEPDLVISRDGVLLCRHENEISETTDVADHAALADRRTTKVVDGRAVTGWFAEDLTVAELATLRARERLPALRGTAWDGQFPIPTFADLLALVADENARPERHGRPVGIYPETKHPSYFAALGLPLEPPLLAALRHHGLDHADAPVFLQSFEVGNLRRLAAASAVRRIQLLAAEGGPWDLQGERDPGTSAHGRRYTDFLTPAGLAAIARYAHGIGVEASLVLPRDGGGHTLPPTSLVRDAHAAGLVVHAWTLRAENTFLPSERRHGSDPRAHGDLAGEVAAFFAAGVDGVFIDHPAVAVRVLEERGQADRRVDPRS